MIRYSSHTATGDPRRADEEPTAPGAVRAPDCPEPLGLTVTEATRRLGIAFRRTTTAQAATNAGRIHVRANTGPCLTLDAYEVRHVGVTRCAPVAAGRLMQAPNRQLRNIRSPATTVSERISSVSPANNEAPYNDARIPAGRFRLARHWRRDGRNLVQQAEGAGAHRTSPIPSPHSPLWSLGSSAVTAPAAR